MPPKLGILAGGGDLPAQLIAACRSAGREFYVIAFEGQANRGAIGDAPHAWVRLGAVGKALELLREAGVEELVLAGAIKRPSLTAIRPDRRALRFLATLGKAALGDDSMLRAIVRALEEEGFRVVGPDTVLDDLLAVEGVYGAHAPDEASRRDIAKGVEAARGIGLLDIGQAAIVQDGVVLGVEDSAGTDALIERCAALIGEGPGGVLVKTRKPQQDERVDLPTIGVATVETASRAGLRGVAVEAGGALVVDRAAVVTAADKAGLFVVGVAVPE